MNPFSVPRLADIQLNAIAFENANLKKRINVLELENYNLNVRLNNWIIEAARNGKALVKIYA